MTASKATKERTILWEGMNKYQFDGISEYIREMADSIALSEWRFRLLRWCVADDEDKNPMAQIMCLPGQLTAEVQLCRDFNDHDLELKRHCLIHELCHCHMRGMQRIVFELDKTMGRTAWDAMWTGWDEQHELATDAFARVIGRLIDDSSILHLLER